MVLNKAKRLLEFVEELLNSGDDYNDKLAVKDSEGKTRYYDNDDEYVKSVHDILRKEANKKLNSKNTETDKYKAAKHYVGSGYKNMNHLLSHGTLKYDDDDDTYGNVATNEKHIKNLKTLTKNPTKHEFIAYRGMRTDVLDKKIRAGSIIHDKGFTSVSLRPSTAGYFGQTNSDNKNYRNFRIHITPGIKGHYVSNHEKVGGKDYVGEAEFVLHPGTKFKVGKIHTMLGGRKYTDLHIHSQEE